MCEPPRTVGWVEVYCVLIHLSLALPFYYWKPVEYFPEYLRILDMK